MMVIPLYNDMLGNMGSSFVKCLTTKLGVIHHHKWNIESFIIFKMVMLKKSRDSRKAKVIRSCINNFLASW